MVALSYWNIHIKKCLYLLYFCFIYGCTRFTSLPPTKRFTCVDDQLLYINLYFARCVYTSFTVICSEKSTPSVFYVRIQVLCVVCTYSPIQHTSWVLSVMNCNEFSTLLLLVYMPLMLKHPFLCSVFVPIQIGFYFR